jgi:CRAL/TRIO domain
MSTVNSEEVQQLEVSASTVVIEPAAATTTSSESDVAQQDDSVPIDEDIKQGKERTYNLSVDEAKLDEGVLLLREMWHERCLELGKETGLLKTHSDMIHEWARLASDTEHSDYFSDNLLKRFVMARKLDISRASVVLFHFLELEHKLDWHKVPVQRTLQELAKGKFNLYGLADLEPHGKSIPVVRWRAALHVVGEYEPAETLKCFYYALGKVWQRFPHTACRIMLGDMENFGFRQNFDVNAEKLFLDAIQKRSPVRLSQALIVKPPWYFNVMFTLLKPFLSAKLQSRMKMIHGLDLAPFDIDIVTPIDLVQELENDVATHGEHWWRAVWR